MIVKIRCPDCGQEHEYKLTIHLLNKLVTTKDKRAKREVTRVTHLKKYDLELVK